MSIDKAIRLGQLYQWHGRNVTSSVGLQRDETTPSTQWELFGDLAFGHLGSQRITANL